VLRICTICARGGSKGVPNKNIRPLLGKPLIVHSIEQARHTGLFATLAVSSDSDEILGIAGSAGVEHLVKRPDVMASDRAAKLPAIQHCVRIVEEKTGLAFDLMVDLDATAPLRTIEDIAGAVALQEMGGCSNVITGCPAHRSPYFNLVEATPAGFVRLSKPGTGIVRRQDSPACYDCNASIYVWPRATFFASDNVLMPETKLFEMPRERSLDIDTELDFALVEFLMQRMSAGTRAA
jgi:N-acylneuraminate cytidylyltransferase/CMP-N,N'-diacetyllegionaminic acid synthase